MFSWSENNPLENNSNVVGNRGAPREGESDAPVAVATPIPPPYVDSSSAVASSAPPRLPNVTPVPSPYVAHPSASTTSVPPTVSHSAARATSRAANAAGHDSSKQAKDGSKKKKKKQKSKPGKAERRTSFEAVLLPPPKHTRQKEPKRNNSDVLIVPEGDVVAKPPPFLVPSGTMKLSRLEISPKAPKFNLNKKVSEKCTPIVDDGKAPETKRLRESKIPIEAAEVVLYVHGKKDKDGSLLAESIELNTVSNLAISRTHRSALLTRGSLQLKRLPFSITNYLFGADNQTPSITMSLFDLRGVHVSPRPSNAVIVAFRQPREESNVNPKKKGKDQPKESSLTSDIMRYAFYQTPETSRFLVPLTEALVAAYTGVPRWAIPITWSGNLPSLPAISPHKYQTWMGKDGGFSASLYAAHVAFCVQEKLTLATQASDIAKAIEAQQPRRSFSRKIPIGPTVIDLPALAKAVERQANSRIASDTPTRTVVLCGSSPGIRTTEDSDKREMSLVVAGLHALSFNLVFRTLKLRRIQRGPKRDLSAVRNALGRALLYNVTLREVDFESSDLSSFGEIIGSAWAMNAQPLISRINFSGCNLTDDDVLGLLHGLARIWCGGTALAESVRMANNSNISTKVWDVFFRAFIDPSTLSNWPQHPPPPPNLSFLQELDLRGSKALCPGLVEISGKLTGLRSLKLSSSHERSNIVFDVLSALSSASAPLETFEGNCISDYCIEGLFRHCTTLRDIALNGFKGDASPLLSNWPQAMPKLSVTIGKEYTPTTSNWGENLTSLSGNGFSPGTLTIYNSMNFGIKAMEVLGNSAIGLKKLVIHGAYYWQLVGAAPMLADCGLEILHIHPPDDDGRNRRDKLRSIGLPRIEQFWKGLGRSKTLRDLQCPNQLMGGNASCEVAMVGRFLKANRSVQSIGFDHEFLVLNVEDVKVLRSAFYGNKKVVRMEYLTKAKKITQQVFKNEIDTELRNVRAYKAEIKRLFKRAYSKYNWNWRDRPNREKLPWVEKIRVSKRRIGKLNRDQAKIASLLNEIMNCISQNEGTRAFIEEQKTNERLVRRERQLKQLADKKKKFVTNLVTKLRKAKIRGRQEKSAKTQVPRSTYYKSRNIWPSNRRYRRRDRDHSSYFFYNDPYHARYRWGYYGYPYHGHRYCDPWSSSDDESNYKVHNDDIDLVDFDDGENDCVAETDAAWDTMLSDVEGISCEPEDPWANIDGLIQELNSDFNCATNPEYLANIHEECSELGIDVVEDISATLDIGASVADKLDEIGTSTNASNEMLTTIVDSSLEEPFDLAAIENSLPDTPEYENSADVDDIMDADDAVGMYAGAGPRDLDDGGPSFGGCSNAALAGARRRAIARKKSRVMTRIRDKVNRRLKVGYQTLSIVRKSPAEVKSERESAWPKNIVNDWIEETRILQIKAFAESDIFDLPDVSSKSTLLITEWSCSAIAQHSFPGIEVVLVTQCSMDRLPNLQAQLACWTGKASVAIYLKSTEDKLESVEAILSTIKEAKRIAGNQSFDVAVTIVEGCMEEESYPINYLRNVALLEARRQHLRFNASLEASATLLVDVDFRPSANLHQMLHSKKAAHAIVKEGEAVVCPAFECMVGDCPQSIMNLKQLVDEGQAEGFHQSYFPQGHGPTQFDIFWEKSMKCPNTSNDKNMEENFWNESYNVKHEELFEPYVVMSSGDVPLYDERFQGYGLNKVSHLASVSREKKGKFLVIPGVFLVAPAHERSESWSKIYGNSRSDENKFNQWELKGLYYNFKKNLEAGKDPVVSENTRCKNELLSEQEKKSKQEQDASNASLQMQQSLPTKYVLCY